MKFYIDGREVTARAAQIALRARCHAAGVMYKDAVPDFAAACASEWGRDMLAELSGYSLEIIAPAGAPFVAYVSHTGTAS
jgi:hypothetical protein